MPRLGTAVVLTLAFVATTLPVSPAEPAVAQLPTPRAGTSAVFDGRYAYVFGGDGAGGAHFDEIVRFDPLTDEVRVLDARLPTPRTGTSAVWDGHVAWIFGGRGASGLLDEVVRFDPATGAVDVPARLPRAQSVASVAWTGSEALLFGGSGGTWDDELRRIVRFDPTTASARYAAAMLPDLYPGVYPEWSGTTAFWESGHAYVHVPWDCSAWCGSGRVFRYDPASETVAWTTLAPRYGRGAATHDGEHAYTIGGFHRGGGTPYAYAYDLDGGAAYTTTMRLPSPRYHLSAVFDGRDIIAFGGVSYGYWQPDSYHADIVRLQPRAPGEVGFVRAATGSTPGEVVVHWRAPADTGGFAPLSYTVLRDGAPVATVPASASGLVDRLDAGATASYAVQVTTPKGTSAPGASSAARAGERDARASVLALDHAVLPPDTALAYGGAVTFTKLGTQRGSVRDEGTDGRCFDFRRAHGWRYMQHGDTWDVRILYEPEEGIVHVSEDGRTFHPCDRAAAAASAAEAVVPFETFYYGSGPRGRLHALAPAS